ncbi:hypothetical protein KBB96_20200 [Luteolibacter ambystomatis]|uniref:Uncharacterized protein n=1 Tax=Luteolibacter ambystomatis TaxID=2824561 RepID=A0A975IZP3_9BACT|nr:hypothetical protein [Luteolibacter ambystomatis]QUE51163.1 hypothetical protein KBB96_20200 [Luteolibacter ambystomatis]
MARSRSLKLSDKLAKNRRRDRPTFGEMMRAANQRAHEQANRRLGKRGEKSIRAAIAATAPVMDDSEPDVSLGHRMMRWLIGLALLPFGWVTTWTFFSQFSHAAIDRGFWQTSAFWYFATGALLMVGWFLSGLLQSVFLYLYVLGHELTHAIFVYLCRGKVTGFHVSLEGGYITTNKTNIIIALSPYFVPFWSAVVVGLYLIFRHTTGLPVYADKILFAATGFTWTFHFAWTLWMIPRDQPDLKENGTFLSLTVIYLANLLVMALLLCLAADNPWLSGKAFVHEWVRHAAVWGENLWLWTKNAG